MLEIKRISSLEKISGPLSEYAEITSLKATLGERVSFQVGVSSSCFDIIPVTLTGSAAPFASAYFVEDTVLDLPAISEIPVDDGYITLEAGLMPDILVPAEERNFSLQIANRPHAIWIDLDIPADAAPGEYTLVVEGTDIYDSKDELRAEMPLTVLPIRKASPDLIYTRWFHGDCIAQYAGVPVYSEEHWALIEEHIKAAVKDGMNMLLTPIHTPPLDTAKGMYRTSVQLVDIEKRGEEYLFGFEKFERFVKLALSAGIEYFEMAHLFSQGGAETAANILVTENGVTGYRFDHHTPSGDPEYARFLACYLTALTEETKMLGIKEKCFYHVSDEPRARHLETYRKAHDTVAPYIDGAIIFDALSDYAFYESGLVDYPVTCVDHISSFLPHEIENQCVYYCCVPQYTYPNSYIAMPLSRVRILGVLLYKYKIKGFLQWGLNFYNSCCSYSEINPYLTTSSDRRFPSGDPFILYPTKTGAHCSIRGRSTMEAISDLALCRTLEERIGREKTVALIDECAGFSVEFDKYPKDPEFFGRFRTKALDILAK